MPSSSYVGGVRPKTELGKVIRPQTSQKENRARPMVMLWGKGSETGARPQAELSWGNKRLYKCCLIFLTVLKENIITILSLLAFFSVIYIHTEKTL